MGHTTIRVRNETRSALREIAGREKLSLQSLIERLIETHETQQFFDSINRGYAELRADPKAWASVLKERRQWEALSADSLKAEPPYPVGADQPGYVKPATLRETSGKYRKRGKRK